MPEMFKSLPNMSLSASDSNDCPQLLRAKKWCAHDFLQSHQMELCLIMIKKDIFFILIFGLPREKLYLDIMSHCHKFIWYLA